MAYTLYGTAVLLPLFVGVTPAVAAQVTIVTDKDMVKLFPVERFYY
jgi:hypothetical protein